MLAALEACGEFLSHLGALQEANAIAAIIRKVGGELPESSPFRWRALLAAIRKELDADPMDVTFVFERLLQLDAMLPSIHSRALFDSPLFLHLLVERFAAAFEGLDAELFKLESDELCQAEGIFETCQLLSKKMETSTGRNETESALKKFLASFERIFAQDEPKECWDAFYDLHHLNTLFFTGDMKRTLSAIESATLGPTKLELAFPTKDPKTAKKCARRAFLEKLAGSPREWQELSQFYSLPGVGSGQAATAPTAEQEQERPHEPTANNGNVSGEVPRRAVESTEAQDHVLSTRVASSWDDEAESVHSDISEPSSLAESSRPPRASAVARTTRVESCRSVPRPSTSRAIVDASDSGFVGRVTTRRKRVRWSEEEVAALLEGYRLFESYSNVWVLIQKKFPVVLQNRSNVDLKDKYRNLLNSGRIPPANGDAGTTDNDADDADGNVP